MTFHQILTKGGKEIREVSCLFRSVQDCTTLIYSPVMIFSAAELHSTIDLLVPKRFVQRTMLAPLLREDVDHPLHLRSAVSWLWFLERVVEGRVDRDASCALEDHGLLRSQ